MKFEELIKSAGVSRRYIEQQLSLKPTAVDKWIQGKAKPKITYIRKLAAILNCTDTDIINCFEEE